MQTKHNSNGSERAGAVPALALLRQPQVLGLVPFSKSTLWASIKRGDFPAPIRIGLRAVAWRVADVEAWLARRAAQANGQ